MKKVIPTNAILIPDNAECKFQGVIYDVYQWQQAIFDGSEATFEMLRRADTVDAICIVDGKILIINDEQPHTGSSLSLPGGRVDKNDPTILSAAEREVTEETGYSFKNWRLVSVGQPHHKIEWFIHTFIAWDVIGRTDASLDAGEKITLNQHTFEEVKELVSKRAGYLGELQPILEDIQSIEELHSMPAFVGQEVDR